MSTILLVNDHEIRRIVEGADLKRLNPGIKILEADSLKEAHEIVLREADQGAINIIVLEGSFGEPTHDMLPFVKKVRDAGFIGPLIAGSDFHDDLFVVRGYDIHKVPDGHRGILQQITEMLAKSV